MCEAPENTISAFNAALTYPIDGLELDVQMSSDGVPVVFHDKTMQRIIGLKKRIADLSYRELSGYDWGGWFSSSYRGEKIPSLEQVLRHYGDKTRLFIEIKSDSTERRSGRSITLTHKVLEMVKSIIPIGLYSHVVILSFDPDILCAAHRKASDIKYVLNIPGTAQGLKGRAAIPDFLFGRCISMKRISRRFIKNAHDCHQSAITYSCNSPKDAEKAFEMQVDIIITDKPGWLTDYVKKQFVISS